MSISHETFFTFRYNIMLTCWHDDPKSRPQFYCLVKSIKQLLGKETSAEELSLRSNPSDQRIDQYAATISADANAFETPSISEENPIQSSSMQGNHLEMRPITKSTKTEDTRL